MPYPTDMYAPEFPVSGPFTISPSGIRYTFGTQAGELFVSSSADFGATWVRADPGVLKLTGHNIIACVQDANFPVVPKVYVVWLSGIFPGPYTYTLSTFNAAAGVWAADIPSALVEDTSVAFLGFNLGRSVFYVAHRAADNKIVLWTPAVLEVVGGADRRRCQIAFCDLSGGGWSGYTQVGTPGGDDADYRAYGCVSGAGGLTHLFLVKNDQPALPLVNNKDLIHVSLTAADALSANQVMQSFTPADCGHLPIGGIGGGSPDATPEGAALYTVPIARTMGANVEILLPYITETAPPLGPDSVYSVRVAKALSQAVPVWSVNTVETSAPPLTGVDTPLYAGPALVNRTGNVLSLFWGRRRRLLEPDRVDLSQSADGLAWSVPVLFYSDVLTQEFLNPIGLFMVDAARDSLGMFANFASVPA